MAKKESISVHLYGFLHLCIPRVRHECLQISQPPRSSLADESDRTVSSARAKVASLSDPRDLSTELRRQEYGEGAIMPRYWR